MNLLAVFVDFRVVKILLPIVLVLVTVSFVYKIVMWVLRKIPVASIN